MRKGKKGLLLLALGVVLALGAATAVVTEVNLRPIILNTAESRVRAIALDAVNSAIARNLSAITYEDLIRVDTDGQGRVTLLQANTVNMNRISTQTALTAQQYIADIADQSIRISIGSATGSPLLAPGEDGINGVNLANSSQLSAWTGREVSNPCDPEEYAAELNKLIEAEGKFPVRE